MKRVVLVANGFQEEYIYNFVNSLAELGIKVLLIGGDNYLSSRFNCNVLFLNLRGKHYNGESLYRKFTRNFFYYFKLIFFLIKSKYHTVHMVWIRFPILDGVLVSAFIKLLGKQLIYTVHNPLPHHKTGFYHRVLFNLIYKIPDKLVVHTRYISNVLIERFNVSNKKILFVEHGLYEVDTFPSLSRKEALDFFHFSDGDRVLLFFGKVAKYKGLEILLDSMKFCDNHRNFKIIVAGKVSPSYQEEFDNLINSYPYDNLVVINRFLDEIEVGMCFKAATLSVLPYREASQSGVMFMSFSYGVPVIVPSLGSFSEYTNLGQTGLVFNVGDSSSLSNVLVDFLANVNQFDKISILRIVHEKYSWKASCETLSSVYAYS